MINADHLLEHVIKPVLGFLELDSEDARILLLETAMQESRISALVQFGNGPARGIYQMEAFTHDDIWKNFLSAGPRLELAKRVRAFMINQGPNAEEMVGNLYYATAMARVFYLRIPAPLPTTLEGRAAYWKKYYNTHLGRGTEREYVTQARRLAMVRSA